MGKFGDVLCVLIGVTGLLLRANYSGAAEEYVHSYGGNIAASFAMYFIAKQVPLPFARKKAVPAFLALGAVELFEAFDGFGVMTNVYDPFDFAANAIGITVALVVDSALSARRPFDTST